MPQEFCIYKCYSCNIFQVHIVKKKSSNKWVCKMCGEKQSIIKVLGQGSAKECREHVQKLNLMRGMSDLQLPENEAIEITSNNEGNESPTNKRKSCDDSDMYKDDKRNVPVVQSGSLNRLPPAKVSKWACFLDSDSDE